MNIFKRAFRYYGLQKRKRFLKRQCKNAYTQRIGNNYGGFDICPKALDTSKPLTVYSFGIGEDLSFSEGIINNYNALVYAFDPTPKSIKYVENSNLIQNENFRFFFFFLSDKNETELFYLPTNEDWVSGSSVITKDKKTEGIEVEMKELSSIMAENGHDHLDILKMDIEGSEFKVVKAWTKKELPLICQICVEVHDRYFDNGNGILIDFVESLKALEYELISVSESCEELTFLNKKLM